MREGEERKKNIELRREKGDEKSEENTERRRRK